MRGWRKTPVFAYVGTETHDNHSFTLLRHAIVRRIDQTKCHAIVQTTILPFGMMALQAVQMLRPILSLRGINLRVSKLEDDIFKILCEGTAEQAPDVFKNEGLGAD